VARPAGTGSRPAGRLLDLLAAAAAIWAAAALVVAVLVALAVAVAFVLVIGAAVADAAARATGPAAPRFPGARPGYHDPQARAGAGSSGGMPKAGSASRSSASSGATAAASLRVSGGRFHFSSSSFSTDV
jgi:hypothetical protein